MKYLLLLLLPAVVLATYLPAVELIDENGTAYGVKHVDNKPRVSSMSYTYDIAEENISGHYAVNVFGHNSDVAAGSFEVISDVAVYEGGAQLYMSSEEQVKVLSSDVDDSLAGAGAQTLEIRGLDGNYAVQCDTVSLDGQTAVTADSSFLRIWSMVVLTAGATGTNEGIIFLTDNGGTDTLMVIDISQGQSHAAIYTVPVDNTLYITQFWGSEASSKGSQLHFFFRPPGGAWRSDMAALAMDNWLNLPLTLPFVVAESSDIEMRANAVLAGANVMVGFEGWREE